MEQASSVYGFSLTINCFTSSMEVILCSIHFFLWPFSLQEPVVDENSLLLFNGYISCKFSKLNTHKSVLAFRTFIFPLSIGTFNLHLPLLSLIPRPLSFHRFKLWPDLPVALGKLVNIIGQDQEQKMFAAKNQPVITQNCNTYQSKSSHFSIVGLISDSEKGFVRGVKGNVHRSVSAATVTS